MVCELSCSVRNSLPKRRFSNSYFRRRWGRRYAGLRVVSPVRFINADGGSVSRVTANWRGGRRIWGRGPWGGGGGAVSGVAGGGWGGGGGTFSARSACPRRCDGATRCQSPARPSEGANRADFSTQVRIRLAATLAIASRIEAARVLGMATTRFPEAIDNRVFDRTSPSVAEQFQARRESRSAEVAAIHASPASAWAMRPGLQRSRLQFCPLASSHFRRRCGALAAANT